MKLGQVGVGSNIVQNHSYSPYGIISGHYLTQIPWKVDQKWNYVKLISWLKIKLGKVGVGFNIAQNHFSSP